MEAEGNRDESSGVVEGRLDRVHVRPGEGCRVVGLVVQSVHLERGKGEQLVVDCLVTLCYGYLSVKELAKVGDRGGLPWVHGAVHGMEVGDPLNGENGPFRYGDNGYGDHGSLKR